MKQANKELWRAVRVNSKEGIENALNAGADIKALNGNGETAIHIAARWGKAKALDVLLSNGAEIEALNRNEDTALRVAAKYGRAKALTVLLDHGANINAQQDDWGQRTALHLAVEEGKIEALTVLLDHGANTNVQDDLGRTALHIAASNGKVEALKAFVSYGAKIDENSKKLIENKCPKGTLKQLYTIRAIIIYNQMLAFVEVAPIKLPSDIIAEIFSHVVQPDALFGKKDISELARKKRVFETEGYYKIATALIVTFANTISRAISSSSSGKGFINFVSPYTKGLGTIADSVMSKLSIASGTQKLAKDLVKSSAPLIIVIAAIKAVDSFIRNRNDNKTVYRSLFNAFGAFASMIVQGEVAAVGATVATVIGGATIGAGVTVTALSFVAAAASVYVVSRVGHEAKKAVGPLSERILNAYNNRTQTQTAI